MVFVTLKNFKYCVQRCAKTVKIIKKNVRDLEERTHFGDQISFVSELPSATKRL